MNMMMIIGTELPNLLSNFEALRKITKAIVVWIFRENGFHLCTDSKVRAGI